MLEYIDRKFFIDFTSYSNHRIIIDHCNRVQQVIDNRGRNDGDIIPLLADTMSHSKLNREYKDLSGLRYVNELTGRFLTFDRDSYTCDWYSSLDYVFEYKQDNYIIIFTLDNCHDGARDFSTCIEDEEDWKNPLIKCTDKQVQRFLNTFVLCKYKLERI